MDTCCDVFRGMHMLHINRNCVSESEFRSIETVTLVNDEQEGRDYMTALYILETYRSDHVQFYESSVGTQVLCMLNIVYNFSFRFYFNIRK